MDDLRLVWIKDIVCENLQLKQGEVFDELFENDVECAKVLYGFLAGSKDKRCIYFYDSVVEEEVEVEVSSSESSESEKNIEEGENIESPSSSRTSAEEPTVEMSAKEKVREDQAAEEKEEEQESGSSAEANSDSSEEGEEEEKSQTEEISEKKIMKQIVKKTILNVCFNIIEDSSHQKYVYFLLLKFEPIPFLETQTEIERVMPDYFEIGLVNQHPLMTMLDTLSLVFLPLLKAENSLLVMPENQKELTKNELEHARMESIKAISEFTSHSELIAEQLLKLSPFDLPHSLPSSTPEELSQDPFIVEEAEQLLESWNCTVKELLPNILNKNPIISNPYTEVLFWKEKRSELSVLSDHLNNQSMKLVLKVLNISQHSKLDEFYGSCKRIKQQLHLTNDNINYLQNLEPYLKDLNLDSPLTGAIQVIDPLLNIYKLLWTLSEYYGRAENMGRLIEGTSIIVQNKIVHETNIKLLFSKNNSEVQWIAKHCCILAHEWKRCYTEQKNIIKGYEGFQHWYYNNKILFEKTDFSVRICKDLIDISKKMEQLSHILQPKLRMLSENTGAYDNLEIKILQLSKHIQEVDFDIFESSNRALWDNVMQWFSKECENIEEDAQALIGGVLQVESNFENAMMLIKIFSESDVPKSIHKLIDKKHAQVLTRYIKTVHETELQFITQKDRPLKYQGFPQFTSLIIWERHLLGKIKSPFLILRKDSDFIVSEKGQKIQEVYLKVAKTFRKYELEKFGTWQNISQRNVTMCLQTYLLKLNKINPYYYKTGDRMDKFKGTNLERMAYGVNFPTEFQEVLMDSEYLVHMGFKLPHRISIFVSQERTYIEYVKDLNIAVHKVHSIMGSLNYAEVKLLTKQLEKLCTAIHPGVEHIHWCSLSIPQFLTKVKQATDYFGSLVHQMKLIGRDIEEKIDSLKSAKLFHFHKLTDEDVTLCQVFFEAAEKEMKTEMKQHVTTYRSVLPLLYKLESITCNSNTGKAAPMQEYYRQCEIRTLHALSEMVLDNLDLLSWSLDAYIYPYFKALFTSESKLVLASTTRAKQTFQNFLNDSIKSTMMFKRWMDGTCIEAAPQFVNNKDDEKFTFTFYSDVRLNPEIQKLVSSINGKVQKYIDTIKKQK